jgi:toxin ParE1/3/4
VARAVVTPSADADTAEIVSGYLVAARYTASFERLNDHLADFPAAGALRPNLGAHIRIGIVPPYIVIYRHTEADGVVTVLRIVHGSRRIAGKLLRGVS